MSTVISADREQKASLLRNNLPLFRSSFSLSTAAAIAAFGGFVFWVLIAHVAPATRVGEAAALFSSIQFVNYATGLGLPIAVARYGVSGRRSPSVLFNWAIVLTVVSSFVGAAIYFAIVPRELHALSDIGLLAAVLLFGVIVSGISIGTVLDVRLISQGRRTWVVARAVFILLVRIPFIFVHSITTSTVGIFLVAAGAPALCGIVAWLLVDVRDSSFSFPLRPLPSETRQAFNFAAVNGAAQLAVQGPFYALPVIVLLIVSPQENASFYVAWTIATVLFLVVQGIGQALLVEGNRSGHLHAQTRAALRFGLALAALLALVCTLGSRLIPVLYGSSYESRRRHPPGVECGGDPLGGLHRHIVRHVRPPSAAAQSRAVVVLRRRHTAAGDHARGRVRDRRRQLGLARRQRRVSRPRAGALSGPPLLRRGASDDFWKTSPSRHGSSTCGTSRNGFPRGVRDRAARCTGQWEDA